MLSTVGSSRDTACQDSQFFVFVRRYSGSVFIAGARTITSSLTTNDLSNKMLDLQRRLDL